MSLKSLTSLVSIQAIDKNSLSIFNIEKSSLSFDFPIADIEKENEKNDDWQKHRIGIAVSYCNPSSNYQSNIPATTDWENKLRSASTDLYSIGFSGSYYLDLKPNLSLSLGVNVSRISERFNSTFTESSSRTISQDSAIFIVNAQGLQEFYAGERLETTINSTTVQQYNHFYNIGLSLGAMYQKPITENLAIYAEGRVTYSPFHFATGYSESQASQLIKLDQNLTNQLLGISANIGLMYQINEKMSYQLGILWAADVSDRFSNSDLSLKKRDLGLNMGVLFRF